MKINRTVERSIKILELLSNYKDGLTMKEIQYTLDMPKTSAYDILETLVYFQMLEKTSNKNTIYKIGIKSFEIGNSYERNKKILPIISEPLQNLANQTNKTVFYAIENNGNIVYLAKFEPPKAIITTATVGSTNPMYCTSLGKAILAFSDEKKLLKLLEKQSFEKKTKYSLSKDELLKDLEEIKKRGYAIDNREVEEHMLCIGAPIFDYSNKVVGSISVSGLYSDNTNLDKESKLLIATSKEISKKLGHAI
jgi:DNA-binding IclR family transcriptional regulator